MALMPSANPVERVTNLLLVLLDTPRPLSLRELTEQVPGYPDVGTEAARQCFSRDKAMLLSQGVPVETLDIDSDEQKGYRVDPEKYYLPDLGLEPDEQAALNLAVAAVHLGEPTGHHALAKLGVDAGRPSNAAAKAVVGLAPMGDVPALPELFDTIRNKATATFTYKSEKRSVDVAAIRFHGGYWYAIGWDRNRDAPRTFRVDRITSKVGAGANGSAQVPEDFDPVDAFAGEPWAFGEGERVEVDVAVDAAEATRVTTELGPDAVTEAAENGDIVVRMEVTDVEALISWVLGFLDHAEVLRPPEVRHAMIARLEAFATSGGAT